MFDNVPLQVIERQTEIADKLLSEYQKMYKKIMKLHEEIFCYAPEVLEWEPGDSMSAIDETFEDEIRNLKNWTKGMKIVIKCRRKQDGET